MTFDMTRTANEDLLWNNSFNPPVGSAIDRPLALDLIWICAFLTKRLPTFLRFSRLGTACAETSGSECDKVLNTKEHPKGPISGDKGGKYIGLIALDALQVHRRPSDRIPLDRHLRPTTHHVSSGRDQ
jgi:hypothetical protein